MKKRVLQSLEMATLGSSGLPQDTRLLFKGLRRAGVHDVTGLVMEGTNTLTARTPVRRGNGDPEQAVLVQSNYLLALAGIAPPPRRENLVRGLKRIASAAIRTYMPRGAYRHAPFDVALFKDALWRQLFERSLPAADRDLLETAKIRYTNLTTFDCARSVTKRFAPRLALDTAGYDAVIFPDVRPLTVHPRTVKIVRYHDTIPVTDPDLLGDTLYSSVHYRSLLRCAEDSHFVCNSSATREALLRLKPELEPYTHVVPCAMDVQVNPAARELHTPDIVRARLSGSALEQAPPDESGAAPDPDAALERVRRAVGEAPFRYILMVAAIEPKKNVPTAIDAWERVRAMGEDVRLILVGNRGWASERTYAAMRPHQESGALLHLEGVPFAELQALMLNAEMLLFPSYTEGFGYPPMEAMAVGTPAVVSDIPAHRAILEDNALFADPYDAQDIADKAMAALAARRGAPRGQPTEKMKAHLARLSVSAAADQWSALISTLAPRRA